MFFLVDIGKRCYMVVLLGTSSSGILRLFAQLDDSRGTLGPRNDNFGKIRSCLEYSDPDSLLNLFGHLTFKDAMFWVCCFLHLLVCEG